jgi:hypothetical protein
MRYLLVGLNLALVCAVLVAFMFVGYPVVGHDYSLAIPSILENAIYFRQNGLAVQWYTPSFGGGVPVFPDPNSAQYSLWTWFALLVPPFEAAALAAVIFILAGGLASYAFCRRVLKLSWLASVLGMCFFSASGFMLQRLAAGHLGYHAFPLIAVFLLLLLDPALPRFIAGLLFALLVALLIYGAGYFLIILFGLTILLVLPLVYILNPEALQGKRLFTILGLGGGVALLISLGRLSAVVAFTGSFPRQVTDTYISSTALGLLGLLLQMLGTMNLAPLLRLVGIAPGKLSAYMITVTGLNYGYWEFDMSLSPMVFGLILIGGYRFLRKLKQHAQWFTSQKRWIAWLLLLVFTWIAVEFSLGRGLVYPLLQKLPILSSLHVNPRFAAAFIFPLALVAALIYDRWTACLSGRKALIVFLVVDLLALLPLVSYFTIGSDLQGRIYDLTPSYQIYNEIRSGDPMTVTAVAAGIDNTKALLLNETNLQPYDPIFGYQLESFYPEISAGSVWIVSDGYYNMTNPTGYVFPEVNGSRPFERIQVGDEANLALFLEHKQPNWKLPLHQQVLDWVSGLSFAAVVLVLITYGVRGIVVRFTAWRLLTRT